MIGTGFRKLAKQYNMKLDAGVAYGNVEGYATTFMEGVGQKQIRIVARFPQLGQQEQLAERIKEIDLKKEFSVLQWGVNAAGVYFVFHDTVGTIKKIEAFIKWFYPVLKQEGIIGIDSCWECGNPIAEGQWYLIHGAAYYLHEGCAQKVENEFAEEARERNESDPGNYVRGAVGAALGALLGAVAWAIVLNWGYIASLVGLLIGWLAIKGYDMLQGKQGKGKVAIVGIAVVLGVLIGTFAADAVELGKMISNGEFPGYTYGDIPQMITTLLKQSSEYASAVTKNITIGLLFAALGVFALLRNTNRAVSAPKIRKLK